MDDPSWEPKKLNFSQYHPLDHKVWRCRGYYGGIRRHLYILWNFKLRSDIKRRTLCRIGLHDYGNFYTITREGNSVSVRCIHCTKKEEE